MLLPLLFPWLCSPLLVGSLIPGVDLQSMILWQTPVIFTTKQFWHQRVQLLIRFCDRAHLVFMQKQQTVLSCDFQMLELQFSMITFRSTTSVVHQLKQGGWWETFLN